MTRGNAWVNKQAREFKTEDGSEIYLLLNQKINGAQRSLNVGDLLHEALLLLKHLRLHELVLAAERVET